MALTMAIQLENWCPPAPLSSGSSSSLLVLVGFAVDFLVLPVGGTLLVLVLVMMLGFAVDFQVLPFGGSLLVVVLLLVLARVVAVTGAVFNFSGSLHKSVWQVKQLPCFSTPQPFNSHLRGTLRLH
jgi:hypothetical protein